MDIRHIPGFTRVLGRSQGYLGLPVRDEIEEVTLKDETHRVPAMHTLWKPTAEELAVLVAGGGIKLVILGNAHPPVRMEAVDGPLADEPAEEGAAT